MQQINSVCSTWSVPLNFEYRLTSGRYSRIFGYKLFSQHFSRQNSERCLVTNRILLQGIHFDDGYCHSFVILMVFSVFSFLSCRYPPWYTLIWQTLTAGPGPREDPLRRVTNDLAVSFLPTYTLGFSVTIQLIQYRIHYSSLWWISEMLEPGTGVIVVG